MIVPGFVIFLAYVLLAIMFASFAYRHMFEDDWDGEFFAVMYGVFWIVTVPGHIMLTLGKLLSKLISIRSR
jgi:hypothetical protein